VGVGIRLDNKPLSKFINLSYICENMKTFKVGRTLVADTYAEASDAFHCTLLITGERGLTEEDTNSPFPQYDPLRIAALRLEATPSIVVGRIEAGIEKWLPKDKTPDGREGVLVQCWGAYDKKKSLEEQFEKFSKELSIRLRQDVLSASGGTTRVFGMKPKKTVYRMDTEERVGSKCGGGHETFLENGRTINVPLMSGYDFKIDNNIECNIGISGGNFWLMCDSVEAGRRVGKASIEAIKKVDGVVTPFYICPSGSTVKDYPPRESPTNYRYCPSLRNLPDSKVPTGVNSIMEIVIDGEDLKAVKNAMREGILASTNLDGVKIISAGNYKGKLGQYKIYLRELLS
jgi:formylmethanofuran--tetrahydromethanopterin N-formyltransferase